MEDRHLHQSTHSRLSRFPSTRLVLCVRRAIRMRHSHQCLLPRLRQVHQCPRQSDLTLMVRARLLVHHRHLQPFLPRTARLLRTVHLPRTVRLLSRVLLLDLVLLLQATCRPKVVHHLKAAPLRSLARLRTPTNLLSPALPRPAPLRPAPLLSALALVPPQVSLRSCCNITRPMLTSPHRAKHGTPH